MTSRRLLHAAPIRVPRVLTRWSTAHPWWALGAWLGFIAVAVSLAVVVPDRQVDRADRRLGESGRADAMVAAAHFPGDSSEQVLVTARAGGALPADAAAAAEEVRAAMSPLPGVAGVAAPARSADGSALLVSVSLRAGVDDVSALQRSTDAVAARHPDLRVRQAGDVSTDAAVNDRVASDLRHSEAVTLPVTAVLMLLAFGAVVAAGLPVLLALTSVAATIGLSAPLSHLVHTEPTVSSMIVLIGMAVGVDYSLFWLRREREERLRGRSTRDAVATAAATSGHAILVSGFAVVAAMTGLFLVGGATFASLAVGAIVVVGVAVAGSLTVLPALLVLLGHRVDRPRVPLVWRLTQRVRRGAVSRRLIGPVLRHPVVAVVAAVLGLAALAAPALGMRTGSSTLETLPRDIPQVRTLLDVSAAFPSRGADAVVVAHGDPAEHDRIVAAMQDVARRAAATSSFDAPGPDALETSPDGRTVRLTVPIPFSSADPRAADAVRLLRTTIEPAAFAGVPGDHAVGGDVAASVDFTDRQQSRLPFVIGWVVLLTLLVMGASFRSVALALLSAVTTLLSVGAAFGVMTLVFQHGWFHGALGFTPSGFVIDWLPLFVMVVLVGLSMDYTVFVVARVREHVDHGLPTRLAVVRGVSDTAGVVTSAAVVMVSVFAVSVTLSLVEMKTMGLGLAVSVLLDATVIRLVLLPAALVLLGDRVWWPRHPRRPGGDVVAPGPRELVTAAGPSR